MAQELKVMVGLPASGKSTWIQYDMAEQKSYGLSCTVVSRDNIRESLLGEGDSYFDKEKEVYKEFIKEINDAIGLSYEVIYVDATHVNEASRAKLLNKVNCTEELNLEFVVVDTAVDEALIRNRKRKGFKRVPDKAIKDMAKRFTYPAEDEAQGFKSVKVKVVGV